ncbi:MAG: Ig-like domain-containing protein, partial [Vicinamibacterales bacterium]|nr:Ig-like domain-containing protein [Vicinamibacterales bacterium]
RGTQPVGTTIEITADQAPSVAIASPADGTAAANTQRITLEVTGADDVGLTQIGFRAETGRPTDASAVAISPSATTRAQSFGFNMPENAAPGARVPVTVTVRDTRGQTSSATIALTVTDALAPAVTITGTASGTRVLPGSQVQVIVAASDAGGVRSVTFRATGAAGADETRTIDPALSEAAVAFTLSIPAAAAAGQTISLDATATDAAGNTGTAARLALAVADQAPPRLTLTTGNGRLEAVPGTALTIVADAEDEVGVARIAVRGDGAFSFLNGRSFSPALGLASARFTVDVPAGVVPGSTLVVTASAVDLGGNTSDPVTLLLPVRTVSDVTVGTVLMLAGERAQVPVTLSAPAPTGGLTLSFTSRNANIAQPATSAITIAEGQTAGTLQLDGISGGTVQIDVFAQSVLRTTFTATVRGGIVQGIVRGLDGQPASGIDVSVTNGDQTLSTSSGADGKYFFEGIDRQSTVEVKADDPGSRLIGFARGPMNRLNGFVTLDIALVEAGRISGVVKQADGTLAGPDALVQLYRSSTGGLVSVAFTDAESRFEFPLVELAAYRLDASRPTTGDRGRATTSVDESGEAVTADVTFLGRGVVTGTVRSGGTAVPNAPVTIYARNIFETVQTQTNADPQGVYRLEGVLVGSVSVSTRDEGTDRYAAASGTLDANGQTRTLDLALEDYATLRGQVRRADNLTPVPGARVDVGLERVTADENGNYVVPFLPLRAHTIVATDLATAQSFDFLQSAVGAVTGRTTVDLSQAAHRSTVTRDVVLLPVGSIVATVLDGTGQPAANATVTVTTTNTSQGATQTQRREARTDALGLAILDQVIAGSYSARALKSSLLSNTVTGTLAGGTIAEIELTLAPTATIAGTLTGPDGQTPFAGGYVSLDSFIGFRSVQVGADGRFAFPGLQLGTYTVYGWDASRRLRAYVPKVVVDTANATKTVDVALAGTGTVSGRVTGPTTGPGGEPLGEPGITVTLQSFAPAIGGTYSAVTNAAGFYAIPNVVSGSFRLSVFDPARQLAAEAVGEIPALGGDVGIDLALV